MTESKHSYSNGFAPAVAALVLLFAAPLWWLGRFALGSELFSYILVVPAISLGMIWLRPPAAAPSSPPPRRLAAAGFALGLIAAGGGALLLREGGAPQDILCLATLGFVFSFAGVCAWFLGRRTLRDLAFPLAFLALMAPLPLFLSDSLETFFQYTSASAAYGFFLLAGMPVLQRGNLGFQLPGMNLEVAPQCSGLHSSLALLIISLPAGYLLLRSPWRRALLTAAAIPLGILRNGFRIFTIGELCVRVGPQMIDSYIHRTGGWMFFLLSLVPFFLLLFILDRTERAKVIRFHRRGAEGAEKTNSLAHEFHQ